MKTAQAKPDPRCQVCNYKPSARTSTDDHDFWECSHVECPHRKQITAAPCDLPPQKETT